MISLCAFALSPAALAVTPAKAQTGLDAQTHEAYQRAAFVKTGQRVSEVCASCHGATGTSVTADVPNMAGQNESYLFEQLRRFSSGERGGGFHSKFMRGLTNAMHEDEKRAVTSFYAQQSRAPSRVPGANAANGKVIYAKRCVQCHGDDGAGAEDLPLIAGQQPGYLDESLERYRKKNGDRLFAAMTRVLQGLTDAEMAALVDYVSSMR